MIFAAPFLWPFEQGFGGRNFGQETFSCLWDSHSSYCLLPLINYYLIEIQTKI
jgi:hypothetical protein